MFSRSSERMSKASRPFEVAHCLLTSEGEEVDEGGGVEKQRLMERCANRTEEEGREIERRHMRESCETLVLIQTGVMSSVEDESKVVFPEFQIELQSPPNHVS